MIEYDGQLAVQQRVLPNYRVPFFDLLAQRCRGGLVIFAGRPLRREAIPTGLKPEMAELFSGQNRYRFFPGHPLFRCVQPQLPDWVERQNPDALIVEANPRYPSTLRAIRRMRTGKRPVLGWGLGIPGGSGFGPGLRALVRTRLFRSLDGIIAYSSRGAEEYLRTGYFPPGRIFVAFNAVAPPPVQPPADPGSGSGPMNVLFVGRLQRRKRLEDLFSACAALPESLRPELTVVGEGPDRVSLERAAAETYPHTVFTGSLEGEPLAQRFREADLFVLPGTGGLAVQEAMSYGLPVIVAEGDGTQQDLVRPENGWRVPPGDLQALRSALQIALSDRRGLADKGAESRRITVEEVNIETMADRFISAVLAVREVL